MSSSVNRAVALTHLNDVHASSQGPLIGLNRDAEILSILKRVHAELGQKQEPCAIQARVKPSQYCNAINGTGNYGITWWYAQDDAFVLRTFELVMEARGLTPENKRAQRAFKIAELVRLLTEE